MVSPFMAFARGALEGYNELQAQKAAYAAELAKEQLKQDGKEKAKEVPKFTILDSAGVAHTYFDLNQADTAEERDTANFDNFIKNKQLITDVNNWKDSDPVAFNSAKSAMADFSLRYLGNLKKYDEKEGRYLSVTPEINQAHKQHPFRNIFANIANGMAPNVNSETIIRNYTDNKGRLFFEKEDFIPEEWGYNTKNDLYTSAYDLQRTKKDSDRDLNYYITTYEPSMWKGYAQTADVFSRMRAQGGQLMGRDVEQLEATLSSNPYFKNMEGILPDLATGKITEESIINAPFHADRVNELITMGSSVNHKRTQDAFHYWTITSTKDLAKELGIGDTSVFGERARAARDSLDTIARLAQLYENSGDTPLLGTFLGGGATLIQNVFGIEGTIDQLGDLLTNFDSTYGTKAEAGLSEKMASRIKGSALGDKAENYSRRQVLMELLAYQIAAAIQGGTGGRTISDTDVKRISAALGVTVFASKRINMARLSELANVMDNISKVSTYYGNATTVEALKGAHATSMFMYGVGLDNVGSEWLNSRLSQMNNTQSNKYIQTDAEVDQANPNVYNAPAAITIVIPTEEGQNAIKFNLKSGENLEKNEAYLGLTEEQKNQAKRQFNINVGILNN